MSIVGRGLGRPRSGSAVAGGLGRSGEPTVIRRAISATLSASLTVTATLTAAVIRLTKVRAESGGIDARRRGRREGTALSSRR